MSAIKIIRQGGSLPFFFDLDGDSIEGWVCVITVRQFPSNPAIITRTIPVGLRNSWTGQLSPAETALLDIGLYWLTGELTNAETGEEKEVPERFNVTEAQVVDPGTFFFLLQDSDEDVFLLEEGGKYLQEQAP